MEIINHRDAILYIEDLVKQGEMLSEWQIKSIHQLVLKGIDDHYAGQYRDQQVFISGAQHIPPEPYLIREEMDHFIKWYKEKGIQLHPIERAALVHGIFVRIHPFIDGNGRTSRLLLNLELMKNGYPPIVIHVENRLRYYSVLDKAYVEKDYNDFIELIKEETTKTMELYLKYI